MTGIYKTLKNKLTFFSGSIILIGGLIFILQYNNYFYSNRYVDLQKIAGKLTIYPDKINVIHQQFLKSELFSENYYITGSSFGSDTVNALIANFIITLDSISNDPYLNPNKHFTSKINGIKTDCKLLQTNLSLLHDLLIKRGFFTTGKAGEWTRFGMYLEEYAQSLKNTAIIKDISQINKQKIEYQFQKQPSQLNNLDNLVFALKVQLTTKNPQYSREITEAERLQFIKELDNFSVLTAEVHKIDNSAGFLGNTGQIGETNTIIKTLSAKSEILNKLVSQTIQSDIANGFYIKSLIILLIGLLYLWLIKSFLNEINYSVTEINRFASELVKGKLPQPLQFSGYKEFSEIAELFNSFVNSSRDKIKFATSLGSGKTDISLVPLSDEDTLSNALLDMEKSLIKAKEEDKKYKIDEQKRAWANEGLAKFSEILRMQTDNLSTLSDEIIGQLVKYLKANQGNIFLYNDDSDIDIHLELISAFAYDRKKYIKKRIEIGEGLVGTCAQEKQTIFLTEIPEDYMEVSSGLGDAPPRSILIVPLRTEENIFGILEIASFQPFEIHEIEFVERLAQSIASTFATVKININTARLLEQSKRQAEEMAQQEEEMRQNFEELQATQEESARREAEIASLILAVESSSHVLQTDMEGRIIEVNKKFSTAVKLNRDELLGQYLKQIFSFNTETDEFYSLIHTLKQGQLVSRSEKISKENNQFLFFDVHYSPISDREGRPYKVLCIASNLTNAKNLESTIQEKETIYTQLHGQLQQFTGLIDQGFIQCIIAPDTTIIEANSNYCETTGYSQDELIGASYRKFLKAEELKQFELIWLEIQKDKTYKGVVKRTSPTNEEHWLMANFIPYKDEHNKITKYYLLAQDITEKKLRYQVLEEANKEIERLKGLQNQA